MELQVVISVVPAEPDQSEKFRFPDDAVSVTMLVPVTHVISESESPLLQFMISGALNQIAATLVDPDHRPSTPPSMPDIKRAMGL